MLYTHSIYIYMSYTYHIYVYDTQHRMHSMNNWFLQMKSKISPLLIQDIDSVYFYSQTLISIDLRMCLQGTNKVTHVKKQDWWTRSEQNVESFGLVFIAKFWISVEVDKHTQLTRTGTVWINSAKIIPHLLTPYLHLK